MKKRLFRFLATTLAAVVTFTSIMPTSVYASQTESQMVVEDEQEVLEETVSGNGAVSDNSIETFGEEGKLNYLYLEKPYVETPSEQNIMVSFGDENTVITKATLVVENYETKEKSYYSSEDCMDNLVLFNMGLTTEDTGVYEAVAVSVTTADGKTKYVQFEKTGMDAVYYGVNEEVVLAEEEPVPEEEVAVVETQIVTFEEGEAADTSEKEIVTAVEEALDEAETNVEDDTLDVVTPLSTISTANMGTVTTANVAAAKASGNLVVVIDPGHDNTHAGARANGLKEEELTLKIAKYCKEELENYSNVTVYMTRTGSTCPYPGTTSTACNKNRVNYAQSVGADVYVSIHLNSAASASAKGAEVFYPNSSYNASIGQEGANLANKIVRQLAALGLSNRGIAIRNSEDNTLYPDGSLADYYGVIKNSKLAGFPAVIVEHAFLTNASDAAFLSSEDNLKKLGVADATGVAEYYGLSSYTVEAASVTVGAVNASTGAFSVNVSGVTPTSVVSNVKVAVWTSANGQDDLKWYTLSGKNGNYSTNVNISNHNGESGTYNAHVYAVDIKGKSHLLDGKTLAVKATLPTMNSVTATVAADGKNINVVAEGVADTSTLKAAVWSASSGQNDLKWYTMTNNGNGKWSINVPLSSHDKAKGTYNVHLYAQNPFASNKFVGNTTFNIEGPIIGAVLVENIDNGAGAFGVKLQGVSAKAGISKIEVAVWSDKNQKNLRWYVAEKQSDGSYAVNVNIANHGYEYGTYQIHAYAYDTNGISGMKATTASLKVPTPVLIVTGNGNQTQYTVKASNVGYAGGVKGVRAAVWSNTGGQDDLRWYPMTNNGNGTWTINVPISNHKTAGTYQVHLYIDDKNGASHFSGNTTFSVAAPMVGTLNVSNVNDAAGTFKVNIGNLTSVSGISRIEVAVWSDKNQKNLRWYVAEKQSDGSYAINVNIANHGYEYGTYQIHAYTYATNGVSGLKSTTTSLKVPTPVLTVTGNGAQTQYTVKASNVGYAGGVKGVRAAVWSNAGGQDDLKWYAMSDNGNGTWSINVPISNHKTAGTYQVHLYIDDKNGASHFARNTTFNVAAPTVSTLNVSDVNHATGTFKVSVDGFTSLSGISKVEVAVWSDKNQKNLRWYVAEKQSDGSYAINVNIANHGYEYGTYQIHAYAYATNGVSGLKSATTTLKVPTPVLTVAGNGAQTQYTFKASNVGYAGGVKGVRAAVWSNAGGQDDLKWYTMTNSGTGTWSINVPISNHKTSGTYQVHLYIVDKNGVSHIAQSTTFSVTAPRATSVTVVNKKEHDGTFDVQVTGASSVSGIKNVQVAVWCAANQSDLVWYTATNMGNGTYRIGVDVRNHKNNLGTYNAHVYVTGNNDVKDVVGGTTCSILEVDNLLYPIMGSTSVTIDQMMAYYNSVTSYPSYYANTDAPTLRQFCQIYIEECAAEGVKAEVAFVQAMKETNFLRYGGDVNISQFNFAGIGATGGVPGNSFASVRIGIRAHVQHLKAYASTEALNQACVDPRFKYVTRNTAPYCEWLGIKENPYGKGWATAVNYGYNVVERIKNLKKY